MEKVVFDDDARREYLTGFSKRKKAKVEEKRERARKREKEDHLAQRRQVSCRSLERGFPFPARYLFADVPL